MANLITVNKRPLVLWSGGLDSTALVIDELLKGDIDIAFIKLNNNDFQQYYEYKAMRKLRLIIDDIPELKGKIINEKQFGYEQINCDKNVFAQPTLWSFAVNFLSNPDIHSSIKIAYVKYDDVWHFKHELMEFYKSTHNLLCNEEELIPIEFPYEWNTKSEIVELLENKIIYSKQILNLIYYCESNISKKCGECNSCIRHKKELK